MAIAIGTMILCAIGTFILMWHLRYADAAAVDDVAPFLLGLLAVGAVLAGAVWLKDKLDRMEETLEAVSRRHSKRSKQNWKQLKGIEPKVAEIKLELWRRSWIRPAI